MRPTRIVDQRTEVDKFELLHNGLLTLFLDDYQCFLPTIITLVLL
ncbi:unnamed protein product [Callosobruchus maculatus]|uniref:Uncharacterized protein n=1 Tax=Callosobruchus maculatus TaxID=64391 RepID=A0A653DBU9_CALMS|nr:unnamed protein product [Callosobruchus maculatus]